MDPNATHMFEADPNRTQLGGAPSLNVTQTIAPVQCPICKTFNPAGEGFCVECGLIFQSALPDDAFGAPAVRPPCLVDRTGREHFLRTGINLVGREGDVMISDGRVSRKHAEVIVEGGRVSVRDLGSTNGTNYNDEPVTDTPVQIGDGEEIDFAGNKMTLSVPGAAGATQALPVAVSEGPEPVTAALLFVGEETHELKVGANSIGRRGENDIVLDDPYVSGSHARIDVGDNGVTLTDLGSTNGSFLNGAKLAPNEAVTVTATDEIILGRTEARIENV
ncbi:MAG: FHA domain-containing protein [Armatimonadota bacterium]|nr:FHA domain-containing protein [Armatimonadota bacterium]